MKELNEQGLPGPDFVVWAPNSAFDAWLPRHAEYHDMRRALHFLLHACLGLSAEEAIEYTPHSFRHFLVEAGQQLRAIKACTVDDMERIGRWNKGSNMPDVYDNASGVSELQASHSVLQALRSGWRPVQDGCLPNPLTLCSSSTSSSLPTSAPISSSRILVANRDTKKVHVKHPSKSVSVCSMWTCGSEDCPSKNAQFAEIPDEWSRCRPCGAALG
jgi:hypothetical protein